MKVCEACGAEFPARVVIDGRMRYLYRRRFCLSCSPFGAHNTSGSPPRVAVGPELDQLRRRRRNAKTYRRLKRHRRSRKEQLIASRGGSCVDCGYAACLAALEFHHRDPATKEFGLGKFNGSLARYLREAEKCDLVCVNCHRLRHLSAGRELLHAAEADARRRIKQQAVAYMGASCAGCGRIGPETLFEFHHWDAATKDFGVSEDGILRSWSSIVAELAKCVMLCANCHREVHAGVRVLDEGLLGLAEPHLAYAA